MRADTPRPVARQLALLVKELLLRRCESETEPRTEQQLKPALAALETTFVALLRDSVSPSAQRLAPECVDLMRELMTSKGSRMRSDDAGLRFPLMARPAQTPRHVITLVRKCTCLWYRRRWHKHTVTLVRVLITGRASDR